MNKENILQVLGTVCDGISQQQDLQQDLHLVNPLLDPPTEAGTEPMTLYDTTANKLRSSIIAQVRNLMETHNFRCPEQWTYELLTKEIIGADGNLLQLYEHFRDLATFGYSSQVFHQLLDFLKSINGT